MVAKHYRPDPTPLLPTCICGYPFPFVIWGSLCSLIRVLDISLCLWLSIFIVSLRITSQNCLLRVWVDSTTFWIGKVVLPWKTLFLSFQNFSVKLAPNDNSFSPLIMPLIVAFHDSTTTSISLRSYPWILMLY